MKKLFILFISTLLAGLVEAEVVYSNDFSGVSGTAGSETSPTTTLSGFSDASYATELDGSGRLQSVNSGPATANYRFIGLASISANHPDAIGVKYTVAMRAPSTGWVGVGFEDYSTSGLLFADAGPWLKFTPTTSTVYGGYAENNEAGSFVGTHSGGDMITVELTYYYETKTVDFSLNGTVFTNGLAVMHWEQGTTTEGDPAIDWLQVNFVMQDTVANGGAYVDSIVVETVTDMPDPNTVYFNDFSGAAGTAGNESFPSITPTGFTDASYATELDGNGRLQSVNSGSPTANYRFTGLLSVLTDYPDAIGVKYKVVMRAPSTGWVGVGFEDYSTSGLLFADAGPWVKFTPTSSTIYGGYAENNEVATFADTHSGNEVIIAEMTYYYATKAVDFSVNGMVLTNGLVVTHWEQDTTTEGDPAIDWLQVNFVMQDTAANGGAYVDSIAVEVMNPVSGSGYEAWASIWGIDLGAETDDYDGDGLQNIYEYGLGGNPTDNLDQGVSIEAAIHNVGGTNQFVYIYPQLSDPDSGLMYYLELNTDLVAGNWSNAGYVVSGTNITGGELNFVTNVAGIVENSKFIRLVIE